MVEPVIAATWRFGRLAVEAGLPILERGGTSLDAVEVGANAVEEDPSVLSVGYGGLPNAEGVVELDAAIMDGTSHGAGAVGSMRGIRRPISVARRVMELLPHVMLAGEGATRFALANGFPECDLLTDESRRRWSAWRETQLAARVAHFDRAGADSHDTVGVLALDARGDLAAGCTTSGLAWKRPGRIGDSPIVGSGLYADNAVGAACATGNGDEIMKACLSHRAVMRMEGGMHPQAACEDAIAYLLRKRPGKVGSGAACLAIRRDGEVGSAATGVGHSPDRRWVFVTGRSGAITELEGVYVTG
ncbi:MAG TPA: N(4)-(beta-N-acetylglucosaminyl)-L-asparaginase [Chthonomonadales bacterium]|nr:N(4)-(beta-N-acetylglucosaminyl)-L-asparaginase [Chthonomonadales bacterium]